MKNNSQPKELNQKSTDILLLLYRFRFLTRSQIQTMLGHKYHSRVLVWISELVEYGYVLKFYEKSMMSDPAIYCLEKEGRKYLKKTEKADLEPLSRVWKEKNYSMQFRHHCLFLADIHINLSEKHKDNLKFKTKTDLYGVENLISPISDALFTIEQDGQAKRYFLDIFDDIPPVYMRMRIKQYLEYYNSDQWQDNTDAPFPEIILICPNPRLRSHLDHFIKNKLSDEEPIFYLAFKDLVATNGLTRETLQIVQPDE